MEEEIQERFGALLAQGSNIIDKIPRTNRGSVYWIPSEDISVYQAWLGSVANLILNVVAPDSYFAEECKRVMTHEHMNRGVPIHLVRKMYGILNSAQEEWSHGLLRKIEYLVAAATFDDFLDHADAYHKGNKKIESSVLASAVLEDTVKKIATKQGTQPSGTSLEPLIDELTKAGVFTLVKAKRIKGFAGVRNHALHAEWEKFDIRDVGELIKGTRELIEEFL
jgi:uncharacterized protein YutE (UPF0331/DUF86 family)